MSPAVNKTIYTAQYATFKDLLKKVRKERSLTQVELAKRLKLTQATVSKIEMAEQRLDIIQLRAWCGALDISLPRFALRLEAQLKKRN
jgi:transcriptional regulator with XRE-family HTH domain